MTKNTVNVKWYDKNLSRPRLLGPRKLLGSKILRGRETLKKIHKP